MKIGGNGGGRQPDYVLKVGIKGERYHRRIGAAWKTKGDSNAARRRRLSSPKLHSFALSSKRGSVRNPLS